MDESLRNPARLLEFVMCSKGRLCILDMAESCEVKYQCRACRRVFLFTPNAADSICWKVLAK
jgi:hypothetical protein